MRGKVAIAGIGQTEYYKHGKAPDAEFKLTLMAILNACENAGIDPKEIDGFSSFSGDRNDPLRLTAALGLKNVSFASMQWGGGGGGAAASVSNAAAAIISGQSDVCVAYRGLNQGEFARFGNFDLAYAPSDIMHVVPYGLLAPPQMFAMKMRRFMHEHGVKQEAMRAVSMTSYHHAQSNPRAIMYGKPLDEEKYDNSRWITEPFHLYDSCLENDGAAAVILVSAERAKDLKNPPCYILSGGCNIEHRVSAGVHNSPTYASADFAELAKRLYKKAGITPKDVDVLQSYENYTGGVVMSIVDCGFCAPEEVNEFFTPENLTLGGKLPLNTSGGQLAECYMHGMGLIIEAARQIYGTSTTQVKNTNVSMMTAGPMAPPTSGLIFGSENTL